MKMTQTIDIAAPPHIVFKWITDPDKLSQWITVLETSETIEDREGHVGSRFRQTFTEHGRQFTMDGQVTRWQQDRAIGIELTSSMMDMTIDQDLEPIASGGGGVGGDGTRLTQRTDLRFKGFMKLIGLLMKVLPDKKGREKLEADLAKLKGFCEAEATEANRTAI